MKKSIKSFVQMTEEWILIYSLHAKYGEMIESRFHGEHPYYWYCEMGLYETNWFMYGEK